MFGFFKRDKVSSEESKVPIKKTIEPMLKLREQFLIQLLNGLYIGGEKMNADPERYTTFNLPPEWRVVEELYDLIEQSNLMDYPLPSDASEKNWKRLFATSIFPISWNIAHHLGLKADEGYIFDKLSVEQPKLSLHLDKAIGWMRHTDSRLENLVYWAIHSQATGGGWPDFIMRDIHSTISEYAPKVDFAYKGSVKRSKSNVIYVWKALGRDTIDGKHLCKIGITNVSGGEGRLLQVAKNNGFNAEVMVFNLVGEELAPLIEKELLKLGTKPNTALSLGDGKTEFRYLSDAEVSSIAGIIFTLQDQNR